MSILIKDGQQQYIVPECTIPGHWIDDSESSASLADIEMANMATITHASTVFCS
jgi:hypothetical protein